MAYYDDMMSDAVKNASVFICSSNLDTFVLCLLVCFLLFFGFTLHCV